MKTQKMLNFFSTLFTAGILLTACQSGSGDVVSQETANQFTVDQVALETEVDNATEDVTVIVDQTYNDVEFANKTATPHERYLPDCATVTKDVTDTTKDITIDFGEACELRNGNTVSGIIMMHWVKDPTALTISIEVTFDNLFVNDKHIEGGYTVLRERSNNNGNPQSTHTFDVTVTWPDNSVASKNGTRTKELIEGQDTRAWGDNVFSITGNWNFTRKDGTVHVATITTPLRKELSCRFIVSGVIAFQKDDQAAVLDFGDGTCDDLGEVTKDGVTETIHLRK
ncbi:MAG: hypothetical protein QM486_05245 [Flavobacteriaceae bacterium]